MSKTHRFGLSTGYFVAAIAVAITGPGARADTASPAEPEPAGDASPRVSDVRADRLDTLFERLETARTRQAAAAASQQIWSIWLTYPGEDFNVRVYMMAGREALARGDLSAAEAFYSKAIDADPDYAESWNRRATVRHMMGDPAGSIADIAEVLAREPRHFGALSGLSLNYSDLGNYTRAVQALEQAMALFPLLPNGAARLDRLQDLVGREQI